MRGPYNEGGLHAERMGWHLPGFDDSSWSSSTPEIGLSEAGAKFYRTAAKLDLPRGVGVSLGVVLGSPAGSKVRAQLYVNWYMFGKFVAWIGNQVVFPGMLPLSRLSHLFFYHEAGLWEGELTLDSLPRNPKLSR